MTEKPNSEFYREFDVVKARKSPSQKNPANHQSAALSKLDAWFRKDHSPSFGGGILVLPTGGGKTFTAVRFLCRGPLSSGYKVLWLAHTHHLLEQAYDSFGPRNSAKAKISGYEVGLIAEPKSSLHTRVVSGTPGHFPVDTVTAADDVLVITLQTLTRAYEQKHPSILRFLKAAGEKLFVVFDEAHHSPAPTYRKLLTELCAAHSKMFVLGLTATPTYADESKKGWLKKLFPQGILSQVSAPKLMADKVLARPVLERHQTSVVPEFEERDYQKWIGTYQDLPENIVSHLAENRERNTLIANTYVENRKRYGKTIVFAERWYQCEQLCEFLIKRGVRAGAVYSHVDAGESTASGRNRRTKDDNARALEDFRQNELDVLVNVRMLTEGTDVPDVQTVFLTRQTTSNILLTQMIGRALRGPKFGGTDTAFIVSFIDRWKQLINWAEYDQLTEGEASEEVPESIRRPPLQLISIDLVRRLARQTDSGVNVNAETFLTFVPVGWYSTVFDALVAETDDIETVRNLVLVFEDDQPYYEEFIEYLKTQKLADFSSESLDAPFVSARAGAWSVQFFPPGYERNNEELIKNLIDIARHMAQKEGQAPTFIRFEERSNHDLDVVARQYIEEDLGPLKVQQSLLIEYNRADRYWSTIYPSFALLKSQLDACINHLFGLAEQSAGDPGAGSSQPFKSPEKLPDREPSETVKRQVKDRDGNRCLCCGETNRRKLQVDHLAPSYLGGNNSPANLQTLCKTCNFLKGVEKINFRVHVNDRVQTAPPVFRTLELPPVDRATNPEEWEQYLRRSINFFYRCAAVNSVQIGKRGRNFYEWQIELDTGCDHRWLKPHLKPMLKLIQKQIGAARFDDCIVERLIISSGGGGGDEVASIAYPLKSRR